MKQTVEIFCPAKVNFFLAVTGRRADGFHDLVSVVAPVDFGDVLRVELCEGGFFELRCDSEGLAVDDSNLVLRAARAFFAEAKAGGGVLFELKKRIPVGAGLGGGSSDAAGALLALNELSGGSLSGEVLEEIAAGIGSDCALFLKKAPVVMRGRGERVELLGGGSLSGRRLVIFKPSFGISTAWAYGEMARAGDLYLAEREAEARLAAWWNSGGRAEDLLFNNMEPAAFRKFGVLPVLLERLRSEFGVAAGMSGSGSACFALAGEDDAVVEKLRGRVREFFGEECFCEVARVL